MKIIITLLSIILIALSSYAQLDQKYIDNFNKNYEVQIPLNNIKINPSGKYYAYVIHDKAIFHENNKKILEFEANYILKLTNSYILYSKNKLIFKRNYTNPSKEILLFNSNPTNIITISDDQIIILYDNLFYLITQNDEKKVEIDNLKISNNKIYFTKENIDSTFIYYKNALKKVHGKIEHFVETHDANILITYSKIYLDEYLNDSLYSSGELYKYKDRIIKNKDNLYLNKEYIYFTEITNSTKKKDYVLIGKEAFLDKIRDIDNLFEKNMTISIIRIPVTNKGKEDTLIKYTSPFINPEKNYRLNVHMPFITEKKIDSMKGKINIFSYEMNKWIKLNNLVKDVTDYKITEDSKKIILVDLNKNFFIYNLHEEKIIKIDTIFKTYTPYEQYSNFNSIYFINYDRNNKELVLQTDSSEIIIDSTGKVTNASYYFNRNQNQKATFVNYSKNKSDLIYVYDFSNSIQKLIHKKNIIFENDSYSPFFVQLNEWPNNKDKDAVSFQYNNLIWTERNILTGTKTFIYNLDTKKTKELSISYSLKHDSIQYKHYSIKKNNELIYGSILFPKHFSADKKYPGIIYIYMQSSGLVHTPRKDFLSNSLSSTLIEPHYLSHNGYFTIYINIPFKDNYYGSHTYFVNEVIENVIRKNENIDIDNIGILGFSRSAGKAFSVITNDTVIKCAIIGNGVTSELLDLTTFSQSKKNYHNDSIINSETVIRFSRRYFSGTLNLRSLDELKNNFPETMKNDPFLKLNKLRSSILFLSNHNDPTIASHNMYFTFIKSQLLGKNTYLLNFLKSDHTVNDRHDQRTFNSISMDYLNFFLKGNNSRNDLWNYNKNEN